MTSARRSILLSVVIIISIRSARAQQPVEVTITEPAIFTLEDLFRTADTVALMKVVSGDTQSYPVALYKGEVVRSFKGAAVGETVFFGPYVGTKLGWEYVLFLRKVAKPLAPIPSSNVNYGVVHYSEVFNEGYSSMETAYECVFDGKDIAEHCDYGVRICTDYIKLPKSVRVFPRIEQGTPFGCRWVRRDSFISVLGTLSEWKN